jgi:hypothetical protein
MSLAQFTASVERRADVAQRIGVMPLIRAHGRSQGQVLGGGAVVARAGERQAQPELGIIIARAGFDDQAEVPGSGSVLASVELCPRQRFQYAPGPRLVGSGAFEQLGGRCGAATAEQVQSALVELMRVGTVGGRRVRSTL